MTMKRESLKLLVTTALVLLLSLWLTAAVASAGMGWSG